MKPIFSRGPSLQIRLILAVLVALGVIIADSRLGTFSQIRTYMDTAVSPFYFISNGPRELLDSVSQTLATRDQLELENRALRQELLLKNSDLLMLGQYKQENARLRELLGSPLRQDEQKMVTQVISTVNDPYSDQVVIDKGSVNGVYEGQPVISDKGVVGQVVAVAKLTSRVLLICDATHALPIQVLRNDIRVIAAGNGCTDDLQLEHLPANTDIRVGDVLVTFENEAEMIAREFGRDQFEVIYPSVSAEAEPPVSVVDKVVDKKGTRGAAEDYLKYLWSPEGQEIARGLSNYGSGEARLIARKSTGEIEELLGYVDEPEIIHRDNLILLD